ncbi:DNA primase [Corynebacterium sp. zg254]|uniref:DNA primase n=1 Tax=Corynebacterium zhongnanshanii TaxID=2768834 RepID=A0ABQ6VGY4_9CORY|nr:DNA primase [Corynebacterium sp. 319]KAB3520889.1 DNA primase [Corynebacterium zhongnanshanii]KAB3538817.1 DNA primase [Corynebacterium sp. 366]MCR5914518.1 DNA primase [Corynebacterium sp. zg254]
MRSMAQGRISERDIAEIRERTPIEEVVGEYVQLKPAGYDSMKGLSPFKDEKTPSFHVRPNRGYFHCFSTGEGGDVFSFLMKMEHITFPEAVEQCAERIGYQITYEGGTPGRREEAGTRQRLVAANKAAAEYYQQMLHSDEQGADVARDFLLNRGFTMEDADHFGCGFAPAGWDKLTKHLLQKGFNFKELEAAGLSRMGTKGPIDRFHRRLLWPIRSVANDVIGFGARKLFDDDKLGKYINTPETLLYKKSKVLFGIDHAKKAIASTHQAVVVEGYTDVMAMHAAGVTTAVAACGTAFGIEHLQMLRRFMLDDKFFRGEIIYIFDGDEAGQKAAMRAFDGNQEFTGRSYVTVAPGGQDPCDIRMERGDAAVRELVATRIPMFEFVIRTLLQGYDTASVDGRVQALRRIVPVLAGIRDEALRDEYARQASGWLGWENPSEVVAQVREEARKPQRDKPAFELKRGAVQQVADQARGASPERGRGANLHAVDSDDLMDRPDPADDMLHGPREVLKLALQEPQLAGEIFDLMPPESFIHATYIAIAEAMEKAGGAANAQPGAAWVDRVGGHVDDAMGKAVVAELTVEDIHCPAERLPFYADAIMSHMQERWVGNEIAEMKAQMQRMRPDLQQEEYKALFADLMALEKYRRSLQERAAEYGVFDINDGSGG